MKSSRIWHITALVIAGEMVFSLPFHTTRFFRPTFLEVFDLSNTQLGDMFAAYGLLAMGSYLIGGPFADRFSTRSLLLTSLVATACGGLYMATFPGVVQMSFIFGFWGVSTIFLFWAALIRATREWGGENVQGTAFGILDGGRGLAAALFALFTVAVLAGYLPEDATLATDAERRAGLRTVILLYSAATFAAGVFVWFILPQSAEMNRVSANPLAGAALVLRRPMIWAQAALIVCAYCGYKGLDNYSLYAVQVLGMDEVEGARLSSYGAFVRPVACVMAGLIADRFDVTRSLGVFFILLVIVYAVLSVVTPDTAGMTVIYANLFISFFAVYALRGIYFALLQETRTPRHVTGVAVGVMSFVGYTPDIFFAAIGGRILDANPGVGGHLDYFRFLTAIAVCGILVVAWLLWLQRSNLRQQEA